MIKILWQGTLSKLLQQQCKLVQLCLQETAHLLVSMPTVSPHTVQLHHICSMLRKFSTANTSSAGALELSRSITEQHVDNSSPTQLHHVFINTFWGQMYIQCAIHI